MKWKTWPNLVTAIGFLGCGVYVWAFLTEKTAIALPALIVAVLTDGLDGYLARKLNQRTRLGWIMDPIRDKVILLSVLGNLLYVYGSPALKPIIPLIIFEVAIFAVNLKRGLPQPIHVLGKLRGFGHYAISAAIIFLTYYGSSVSTDKVEFLILSMTGFSLLAFIGYALHPARKIPHI